MDFLPSFTQYLEDTQAIRFAHLIGVELPGGGFLYLTDYSRDITYDGQIYVAGKVKDVGSVKQTRVFNSYELSIKLTGADSTELTRALNSNAYLNRRLYVHRAYLDDNGDVIPMLLSGATLKIFEGVINKADVRDSAKVGGAGTSVVTWSCSSEFADFKKVTGRITDDAAHRGLASVDGQPGLVPTAAAKRPEYQADLGFYHANKSVSTLAKYQALETRYRTKIKKNWLGMVKSVKQEEYEVLVDRDVDLRYDLTAQYIPVIYGVRQAAGIPVFVDTLVTDPNTVYVVYSFCEGEIQGFLDFYIDDEAAVCWDSEIDPETRVCMGTKKNTGNTLAVAKGAGDPTRPTNHGETFIVDDGDGPIEFTCYHGKYVQTASGILTGIAAANNFYLQMNPPEGGAPIPAQSYWGSDHKLLDTAYVVAKFQISEVRTEIPSISADILGRIVPEYNSAGVPVVTGKTSLNPAWQIADYMQNAIFGGGVPRDRLDMGSFYKTAQLCDVIDTSYQRDWVPYWRYLGWESQYAGEDPRAVLQCNVTLSTEDTVFKNMDLQLQQVDASLNISAGQYSLSILAETNPIADIDVGSVISGNVSVSDNSVNNRYNALQAGLIDPGKQWGTNQITFFNSEYKAEDNNVERKGNFQFPYITNYYTARSAAERFLNASRASREITFTLPFKYAGLEINDHVTFTSPRYLWDKKRWIVKNLEWTKDAKVKVVATEYLTGMFINSPQEDISDGQLPDIGFNVLPANDLQYTPYIPTPGAGIVGKSGTLSWLPSRTAKVAYYLVTWNGLASNKSVTVDPTQPLTNRISMDIIDLVVGTYTFSVRAVDNSGRASKEVTVTATVDPGKVLKSVTGLRVLNESRSTPGSWNGPDLEIAWDAYDDSLEPIAGFRYNLVIETANAPITTIKDIELAGVGSTGYTYSLAVNKADYLSGEGELGAYRQVTLKIRAVADGNRESASWSYL